MDTFPSLFLQQTRTRFSDPAIRYKRHGLWTTWTWADADSFVRDLACGLACKGLKPNDNVAIIGNNIPQLYFAMIAVQCSGAVAVPIHPDSNAKELISLLNDCEAKFAIVQDQQQVDGLYDVIDQCESLREVVYNEGRGMQDYDQTHLISIEKIQVDGKTCMREHAGFFDDIVSKVSQDSDAFILYTSGTSGSQRGAVHTHSSLISTGITLANQESIQENEEVLAFMPLSYAANILFTYTLWLVKGFTINCPENNETVMNDFREIGPTILYAPPHFYKQLYAEIIWRGQRSSAYWFKKWFKIGKDNRRKFLNAERMSLMDHLKWKLAMTLMYNPLKNVFGLSRMRKAFVGGDMMNSEVYNFLRSIGFHLKKTYGTTESAGLISVQGLEQLKTSAGENIVGKPIQGVEVKKFENGELAFRGTNSFKGYYNNTEATASMRDSDGWVRTEDVGEIDNIGAISITDRLDSIGKFSSGNVFAPHLVENALKSSPYIKEALAIGSDKVDIAAFIIIDENTVGGWAEVNNIRFAGYRDLTTKQEVYDLIKETVTDVNAHITQIEGAGCPPIKHFVVMHRGFSVDDGEVTRSHKIKRDVVLGTYKALVDAVYSSQKTFEVKDVSSGQAVAELIIGTV